MNAIISFILGIPVVVAIAYMFSNEVSTRIRNSQYWFVGWMTYMFLIVLAFRLMVPLYEQAGFNDGYVTIGVFLVAALMVLLLYVRVIYKVRKEMDAALHG